MFEIRIMLRSLQSKQNSKLKYRILDSNAVSLAITQILGIKVQTQNPKFKILRLDFWIYTLDVECTAMFRCDSEFLYFT